MQSAAIQMKKQNYRRLQSAAIQMKKQNYRRLRISGSLWDLAN